MERKKLPNGFTGPDRTADILFRAALQSDAPYEDKKQLADAILITQVNRHVGIMFDELRRGNASTEEIETRIKNLVSAMIGLPP